MGVGVILELLHLLERLSVLAFIVGSMLAMGLDLAPRAIVAPLRDLRLVLLALALNFILAPAFAWLLTATIPLQQGHAVGLLLLGGAAGAPFLPKLAQVARGDAGFAAALMALLTAGTILFLPFGLPKLIPGLQANPWDIARPLLLLIVLPMALGMAVKCCAAGIAARAAPILAKVSNLFLVLLVVLLVGLNISALIRVIGSGAIAAVLIFTLGLLAVGWFLGGADRARRGVMGLGTAGRNFGAALVPAASSFTDPAVTVMIVVGAIVALAVLFPAAAWVRGSRREGMHPCMPSGAMARGDARPPVGATHPRQMGLPFDLWVG